MKLEELARTSSTAARTSVSHLDIPAIGRESHVRSWIPVLAGAGVAAAIVAGLAFVASNRTGGDSTPADQVPPVVEVPHLALPPDAGWTPTLATDGADFVDLRGDGAPTFTYYGTAGTDQPYADGDLLIAWYQAPAGVETEVPPDGESVKVRGETARLSSGAEAGVPADSLSLEWIETGADGSRLQIILVSQSFDRDRLVSIAESLVVDTASASATPDLQLGLDQLASADGTPFDAFRTSSDGSLIGYQRTGDDGESIVLSTARGDIDREALVLRWWFPGLESATIDGRPGYESPPMSLPGFGRTTIWAPRDGVVANLTYFGADEQFAPTALAESVIELDDETWAALIADVGIDAAGNVDLTGQYDEVFAVDSGDVAGVEYSWALGLQGDDLCLDFTSEGGGFGSCRPRDGISPSAGSAVTIDNSFGEQIAEVVIAADPAVDDVVEVEGRYEVSRVDADGLSWFVAIGDAEVQPTFEVIIDGEIVDTVDAAVEAVEEAPIDLPLDMVPAAVELGIDDMDVVLVDQSDPNFPFWVGRHAGDVCLVAGGVESDADCAPRGEITVFRPMKGPEGPRTFIVMLDPPNCVGAVTVGERNTLSAGADDPTNSYWIVAAEGESDGWQLELRLDDGGKEFVALPPLEGSAAFPADLCGD